METEKILFFRNFLLRTFLVSVLFTIFFALVTFALWDSMMPWVAGLFRVEADEMGELVIGFFMNLRIVLVFFMLAPAIALHWMAKK